MLARLPRVALELHAALRFDLGLLGVEEGVERHLRVGDEAAPLGQQEAGVGSQPAVFGVERLLQLEVDVLGHAGDLDAAAQLQLAPLAARLRLAQRLLQARGLGVEVADRLAHLLEQGAGLQVGLAAAAAPRLLDLLLALGDPLGQRLDLRLALVEGRLGRLARRPCATPRSPAAGRRPPSRSPPGSPGRGRAARPAPASGREQRVDEPGGEQDDGDCEHDGHSPMVTNAAQTPRRRRDAPVCGRSNGSRTSFWEEAR